MGINLILKESVHSFLSINKPYFQYTILKKNYEKLNFQFKSTIRRLTLNEVYHINLIGKYLMYFCGSINIPYFHLFEKYLNFKKNRENLSCNFSSNFSTYRYKNWMVAVRWSFTINSIEKDIPFKKYFINNLKKNCESS